jgi:hypothetical protein
LLENKEAIEARSIFRNATKGVFLLDRHLLGRAYDPKMGKDAFVLILGTCDTLTYSEATQMIGRSSRA